VRRLSVAALVSFSLPVVDASAEVVAQFEFDGGSLASTATSALATASDFTYSIDNTNVLGASGAKQNSFMNSFFAPFSSDDPWASTLAPSGTNSGPAVADINALNIWKGFTVTKASTVPSLTFEKISFRYGVTQAGAPAAAALRLANMTTGVYFRETGSTGDFTFLGSAKVSGEGFNAGEISNLSVQDIVFTPFVSNGGEFRFYFRDDVSKDIVASSSGALHRLDSIILTAVPEPSSLALLGLVGTAAVARRRMKKAKA
jgi:hypothetical protein